MKGIVIQDGAPIFVHFYKILDVHEYLVISTLNFKWKKILKTNTFKALNNGLEKLDKLLLYSVQCTKGNLTRK